MRYVTYDVSDGTLTGAYLQELQQEHLNCYKEVDEGIYVNWTGYKYNLSSHILEALSPPTSPSEETTREQAKQERDKRVAAITVEVDGHVFDGDEVSQNRMARAILAMQLANATTTKWVLHDNTEIVATVEQLSAALVSAGSAQTEMWNVVTRGE